MNEGERLREEALARAEANASQAWMDAALVGVRLLAHEFDEITTDDVWLVIPEGYSTHEPRAMGVVMQKAARKGLIVPTDRTSNSIRPDCHARPIRIWRSLVWKDQ